MNCDWVKPNITLFVFDELEDADRAEVEQHLSRCAGCSQEAAAERQLRQIMDLRPALDPSESLLAECRMNLAEALEELPAPQPSAPSWFTRMRERFAAPFSGLSLQWQAGLAVTLLSIGFVGGSTLTMRGKLGGGGTQEVNAANIAGVHSINARPDGKLEISLDTLQRQSISGTPDDPRIRQLLISALGDYNSSVRMDSIEMVKQASAKHPLMDDPQLRGALIACLRKDKNPGARMKALEALKGYESQPEVRQALLGALVSDANAGVRIAAIEALSSGQAPAASDRLTIGALQQLAHEDANSYIRLKSADTLRKWNAPVEVY